MRVITQWQILNHFEMSHIDLFLIYGWLMEGKTIVLKWLPPVLSIWWLTVFSKWCWLSLRNDDCCLFEMTMVFSLKWWMDCHFEMMMTFSSKDWWLSLRYEDDALREMGLDALCWFRNDSHISCHRRKMLCPVAFTFIRIDYFEERPYIFGNDSWFQTDSLPPKTLEILSFSKDR